MKNIDLRIASRLIKVAEELLFADSEYIYDPDHKKHPSGGYHKTEKGWSKIDDKKEKDSKGHKNHMVKEDNNSNKIPPLDDVRPMTKQEQHDYEKLPYWDWTQKVFILEQTSHPKILDKMSEDNSSAVVTTVAKNRNTHPLTLEKLSNRPESYIRKCVAENPNTHIKTLEKLSKDSDNEVRNAAKESIKNRNKTSQTSPKKESEYTKVNEKPAGDAYNEAIFSNNPKELDDLSNHSHFRVRETVAGNKNTSESTLRKLSSDEHTSVRAQVARNPKTPKDVLEKLSNEKEGYILGNLSTNPNATPKILKNVATNAKESYVLDDLSNHSDMQVRMQVAHNPNTSPKTLDRLAGDKERQVIWDVAENLNTSTETLDKIANKTNDSDILQGVARNPNTSTETLKKLSNHEHYYVSKAAKENLSKRENLQNKFEFDITKLSPEMREKVKDWDAEDIAKFIGWLKQNKR